MPSLSQTPMDLDRTIYDPQIVTATIASGGTTTEAIDLDGTHLFAIGFPSSFTSSSLTVKVSADNDTFLDLYDSDGNQYTLSVGQGRVVFLDPSKLAAFRYLKLVSGSTEGAERTLTLFTRMI